MWRSSASRIGLGDGSDQNEDDPEGRLAFAGSDIARDGPGWFEAAITSGEEADATWPEVADEIWFKADLSPYEPGAYEGLLKRVIQHLNEKNATLYVKDVFMGSDPDFAVPYRFVGEYAAHAMFVHNMFPKNLQGVKDVDARRWTMLNAPSFVCVPERDVPIDEVGPYACEDADIMTTVNEPVRKPLHHDRCPPQASGG